MKNDTSKPFSRLAEGLIADLRRIPLERPEKMRVRPTRDLAALVQALLEKHQIGQESIEHKIRDHWPELVSTALASDSHPVRIDERGQLIVAVTSSVVREELFHNRAAIVAGIGRLLGSSRVKSLWLRAG